MTVEETIPMIDKIRKEYEFEFRELSNVLWQINPEYDYQIFIQMGAKKRLKYRFYITSSSKENYFFVTVFVPILLTGTKKPVKREFVFSHLCSMLPFDPQPNDPVVIEKSYSDRKKENIWAYEFVEECQREKNNSDFFIYFIQSEKGGAIKIGLSKNPEERLNELQTSTPYKLKLLAKIKGDISKERELHRRFARYRIRGEWFEASNELLSYIEQIKEEKE